MTLGCEMKLLKMLGLLGTQQSLQFLVWSGFISLDSHNISNNPNTIGEAFQFKKFQVADPKKVINPNDRT